MKMNRSSGVAEYQLAAAFDEARRKLLGREFADRLEKPLGYWALPSDRSTPIALLDRPLRELLSTSFQEICATPGIGQKKVAALVRLLDRAAQPQPPVAETPRSNGMAAFIDPGHVSEALWVEWRATVEQHGLGQETLGRLAPSLQELPRVIWNTPLDAYTGLTLAQIRALKTHGEKRVRALLQVFGALEATLSGARPNGHLTSDIKPRLIDQVERWIRSFLAGNEPLTDKELRRRFITPLMSQVRTDLGDAISDLAESRLGLDGEGISVRQVARRLGLTRARVYQLLNDVGAALAVRWPDAAPLVQALRERVQSTTTIDPDTLELFQASADLFFPAARADAAAADDSLDIGAEAAYA